MSTRANGNIFLSPRSSMFSNQGWEGKGMGVKEY